MGAGRRQIEGVGPAGDIDGDGIGDLLARFELRIHCGEGGDCGARSFVLFGSAGPPDRVVRGRLKSAGG